MQEKKSFETVVTGNAEERLKSQYFAKNANT
jgi:hypothetical protein